jgi:hypothetical protein
MKIQVTKKRSFAHGLLTGIFLVSSSVWAGAAPSETLKGFQPHTAIYDVKLSDREDRSSHIRGAEGRLVYEFAGDACEGFVTNFRFVLNFAAGDNQVLTDQQTTTFEAGDGKSFRFASKTYTNTQLDRQTNGSAELKDDMLSIQIRKPDEELIELDEAVFPAQHLASVVDAAKSGETFVRAYVFDGGDQGTETYFTQTVIGKAKTAIEAESEEAEALTEDLASGKWWPVSVSYFKQTDQGQGEGEPFYTVSFKLYSNGVSRDLRMIYEDFSLEGTLRSIENESISSAQDCD